MVSLGPVVTFTMLRLDCTYYEASASGERCSCHSCGSVSALLICVVCFDPRGLVLLYLIELLLVTLYRKILILLRPFGDGRIRPSGDRRHNSGTSRQRQ